MNALLALLPLRLVAPAPTILSVSERAAPGEPVSVVGDRLAGATYVVTPYAASGKALPAKNATVVGTTDSVALLRLPAFPPRAVLKVVAVAGGRPSNAAYVNRPRLQWLDVEAAMAGGDVRVVGRNLSPYGGRPRVTLTNRATRKTYAASVVKTTDAAVRFVVPPSVPTGGYAVALNSGLAGALSASPASLSLMVLPRRADPLSLGVAWGADVPAAVYRPADPRLPAHPAGDGRREDGGAIAVDLAWISAHGGGVLRLEAKTYRIDKGNDEILIRSGTCLRGAGMGKTVLQLGYVRTPDYHAPLVLQGENAAPEGIMDLTVQNLNRGGPPNRVLQAIFGNPRKAFLKRVEFQMGNAHELDVRNARKMVVEGCRFTAPVYPALSMDDGQEVRYLNNTDDHRAGRLRIFYSDRVVVEGCAVHFDNAYRNAKSAETGAIDVSFDQRLLLADNDLGGLGPLPDRPAVDGEVVLDQFAVSGDLMYTGAVASARGRRILAAQPLQSGAWTDTNHPSPTPRMGVFIVAGRGAGQWRKATGWDRTAIDVDLPWTVPPDATSRFAVCPLLAYQQTMVGNRLRGGFSGIDFEFGAVDTAVEGNALKDTGGIFLMGFVFAAGGARGLPPGGPGSNVAFCPAWGNSVSNNSVVNGNGRRATISLAAFTDTGAAPGPLLLANDVRGNRIVGGGAPAGGGEYGANDGLEVVALDRTGGPPSAILQQGTVLSGNTVANSSLPLRNYNVIASAFVEAATRAVAAPKGR